MADFIVSPSQIFDVGVLSVKQFGSKYKVIWSKAVRKKGFQPFDDSADDKENDIPQVNTEKLSNNISRAKSLIFGKGQILRSTPNTAPLICGAYNTQPEGLSTMA